jgi:hypothetical protein
MIPSSSDPSSSTLHPSILIQGANVLTCELESRQFTGKVVDMNSRLIRVGLVVDSNLSVPLHSIPKNIKQISKWQYSSTRRTYNYLYPC